MSVKGRFDLTPSETSEDFPSVVEIVNPKRTALEADLELCNNQIEQQRVKIAVLEAEVANRDHTIANLELKISLMTKHNRKKPKENQ